MRKSIFLGVLLCASFWSRVYNNVRFVTKVLVDALQFNLSFRSILCMRARRRSIGLSLFFTLAVLEINVALFKEKVWVSPFSSTFFPLLMMINRWNYFQPRPIVFCIHSVTNNYHNLFFHQKNLLSSRRENPVSISKRISVLKYGGEFMA